MLIRRYFAIVMASATALALSLSACTDGSAPPESEVFLERPAKLVSADELARCGAAHLADAVGRVLVRGAAGAGAVSVSDLPENHRIVRPGVAVTLDFIPHRLTVHTTRDGLITKLACG